MEAAMEAAVEAAVEAAATEEVAVAAEEILLLQEDHPQLTPEEGITDFLDNLQTYSLGIARRRRSSSRSGNSTTT